MELDLNQDKDYVLIRDGSSASGPLLAEITGSVPNEGSSFGTGSTGRLRSQSGSQPFRTNDALVDVSHGRNSSTSGGKDHTRNNNNNRFIVSTGNKMYIYIKTSLGNLVHKGYAFRFKSGCEIEYNHNHGLITSPGYGSLPYPTNLDCIYHLSRPSSGSLSIKFNPDPFDVSNDDGILVYDGISSTESLFDRTTGLINANVISAQGIPLHPQTKAGMGFNNDIKPVNNILTASSGRMTIHFRSNPLNPGKGWSAVFSADCPVLKVGKFASASSRDSSFGAKIFYTCPPGQEFANGQSKIIAECVQGGKWVDIGHNSLGQEITRIPDCQERYCGPVPQIDNGFAVSATNVTYKGAASYQCYAGFGFASGSPIESIKCTEEGKWERLPTCLASSCPLLPEVPHATAVILAGNGHLNGGQGSGTTVSSGLITSRSYGTIIRFNCDPGYARIGIPVIHCESNGDWSSMPPVCERISCPILPIIENGFILDTKKKYFFGDEARVQCHKGFKLESVTSSQSVDKIKCGANQTFDNVPVCRDVDECNLISTCDSASSQCTNTNGSYYCKCKSGFEPNLDCRPIGDLGLSNGLIPDSSIKVSSVEDGYSKNGVRLDTSKFKYNGFNPRTSGWTQKCRMVWSCSESR